MPQGKPNFRVARDAVWLRETAGRVASVLQAAVPPLSSHPRAAVRAAVAEGAELLSGLRFCRFTQQVALLCHSSFSRTCSRNLTSQQVRRSVTNPCDMHPVLRRMTG